MTRFGGLCRFLSLRLGICSVYAESRIEFCVRFLWQLLICYSL